MSTRESTSEAQTPGLKGEDALVPRLRRSLAQAAAFSFNRRHEDGHWNGEVKANATITAEYVMLRQALGLDISIDRDALISWFFYDQNPDGSWSIAPDLPGHVSTSTEAYFALKLLGIPPDDPRMRQAREFIVSAGGVSQVRILTRIYLATFGLFPWSAVPEMPAELIILPDHAPISIYRLASWARCSIVPLLVIAHHRPIYHLPNGTSPTNDFLDELWYNASNKQVPYSPSAMELLKTDVVALAFTVTDTVLHWLNGLREFPTRKYAIRKCIDWILDRQEPEGDLSGLFPPMHMGILALCLEGYQVTDPPVRSCLQAIERLAWHDSQGKRIQASASPVWDTILTTISLCDAGVPATELVPGIEWIKARQLWGAKGDWQVYCPNIPTGGFSFEYFNRWYPDVDDTAAAILAMIKQDPQSATSESVVGAIKWILGMQNRDGGWGAFDHNNNSLFLNKIPFSDMDALCDPSTADVTGRILEAFGLFLQTVDKVPKDIMGQIHRACDNALAYLLRNQEQNGAWYGRWGSNYLYGTSNVVCGMIYFSETKDTIRTSLQHAVDWVKKAQNSDGGWGETLLSYSDSQLAGKGFSTASQTAWALMALIAVIRPSDPVIQQGVEHLLRLQTMSECDGEASWPERYYTGIGFPNHFYHGYEYYPHYFPMMALGRVLQVITDKRSGALP